MINYIKCTIDFIHLMHKPSTISALDALDIAGEQHILFLKQTNSAPTPMRQIDLNAFRLAERGTPRAINRLIALNVIRARQPVSRADLARVMRTSRAAVTVLVKDLIDEGLVFEGAKGEALRGRKPQFLYIDTRKRCVVAVDLRPTRV